MLRAIAQAIVSMLLLSACTAPLHDDALLPDAEGLPEAPEPRIPPPAVLAELRDEDEEDLVRVSDLVLAPDRLGPLAIGATPPEALRTLLAAPGGEEPPETPELNAEGIEEPYVLGWADTYRGLKLAYIAVDDPSIETAAGVGVGDVLGEVREAYGDRVGTLPSEVYRGVLAIREGSNLLAFVSPSGQLIYRVIAGAEECVRNVVLTSGSDDRLCR